MTLSSPSFGFPSLLFCPFRCEIKPNSGICGSPCSSAKNMRYAPNCGCQHTIARTGNGSQHIELAGVSIQHAYSSRLPWTQFPVYQQIVIRRQEKILITQECLADVNVPENVQIFKTFLKYLKSTQKHDFFLLNCQTNPALFYAKSRTNLSQKLPISQWFTFRSLKTANLKKKS